MAVKVTGEVEIANLMRLAQAAVEGQNWKEAYDYFTRVVEHDPSNVKAWLGKGQSIGWQYTLASPTLNQTLVCYRQAISIGIDESSVAADAAYELSDIAMATFALAFEHMQRFKQSSASYSTGFLNTLVSITKDTVRNTELETECLSHALLSIEALEYAWEMKPHFAAAAGLSSVCSQVVSLGAFKNLGQNVINAMSEKAERFEYKAKEINPHWESPKSCFVVTATMGDPFHPHVECLRRFRDSILAHSSAGKRFISIYNWVGPRCAALIADRAWLKVASYIVVVFPAAAVSSKIMHALESDSQDKPVLGSEEFVSDGRHMSTAQAGDLIIKGQR